MPADTSKDLAWGKGSAVKVEKPVKMFFNHVGARPKNYKPKKTEKIPLKIQIAFAIILMYLEQRFHSLLTVKPCDSIYLYCQEGELLAYGAYKLWCFAHTIKIKTVAGLCAWFKKTVYNRRAEIYKVNRHKIEMVSRREINDTIAKHMSQKNLGTEENEYRYQLLERLCAQTLKKFQPKQEKVLDLSEQGYQHKKIKEKMKLVSSNAAKSYKWRTQAAFRSALLETFKEELHCRRLNPVDLAVIREWLELYDKKKIKPPQAKTTTKRGKV